MGRRNAQYPGRQLTKFHCIHTEFVEGCYNNAVGVEDPDSIPDNQMTASSEFGNTSCLPSYGRLNGARGEGWCAAQANGSNDWLQIDFNRTVEVNAVATQGDIDGNEWVTDFKLSFSSDGGDWTTYRDANGKEKVRCTSYYTEDTCLSRNVGTLRKWHLNLNEITLFILNLVWMFLDKGFLA